MGTNVWVLWHAEEVEKDVAMFVNQGDGTREPQATSWRGRWFQAGVEHVDASTGELYVSDMLQMLFVLYGGGWLGG